MPSPADCRAKVDHALAKAASASNARLAAYWKQDAEDWEALAVSAEAQEAAQRRLSGVRARK